MKLYFRYIYSKNKIICEDWWNVCYIIFNVPVHGIFGHTLIVYVKKFELIYKSKYIFSQIFEY